MSTVEMLERMVTRKGAEVRITFEGDSDIFTVEAKWAEGNKYMKDGNLFNAIRMLHNQFYGLGGEVSDGGD